MSPEQMMALTQFGYNGMSNTTSGAVGQPSVTPAGQKTILPNAFHAMTLQDPVSGNCNIETGASSYLNDYVHSLSDVLNMRSINTDNYSSPTADTASRTITTWRKVHEITVLKAILEYYNVIGKYPFDNESHMQKFYKDWIEWRGVYVDQDVFTNKLVELHQRFFQNKKIIAFGKNVLMDHYDAEIYHLSHLIWAQ
ncbi:ulp1 protease family, C-terminal catalytic domain-containing protein [Tanacetum coccineum]